MVLDNDEKIDRHRAAVNKYLASGKGKDKMMDAVLKYQQTDKYKEYKRQYYLRRKAEGKV